MENQTFGKLDQDRTQDICDDHLKFPADWDEVLEAAHEAHFAGESAAFRDVQRKILRSVVDCERIDLDPNLLLLAV